MSTYCKAKAKIAENQIPAYVKAAMNVVSTVKGEQPITLLKALEQWAIENGLKLSDLYNEAGISWEQLVALRNVEQGDSSYGGPEIEVPSALLITAGTDIDIVDSGATRDEYYRKLGLVKDKLGAKQSFQDVGCDGHFISKIIAVIPPSVSAKIFPNMEKQGTYFTIGIVEDRNHPKTKEQLGAAYNADKPVYPKTVSIACHNDHKRPQVSNAMDIFGKATKEIFRQTWKEEFIAMQNTAQAKKAMIKEHLLKASQSPESKINILSVSEPNVVPNSIGSAECDFTLRVDFTCTFAIKEEFLKEFEAKIEEAKHYVPKPKAAPVMAPKVAPKVAPQPAAPAVQTAPKPTVKQAPTPVKSPLIVNKPKVIRQY